MGQRNGRMIHTFPNGDIYDGDFFDGMRHGEGVYVAKKGYKYVGAWKDDFRHGAGTFTYAEKDSEGRPVHFGTYEGEWKRNMRWGKGIHRFANGASYDGAWVKDKMHGYGIYTFESKDSYEGQMHEGNMHGKGVYTSNETGDQLQGTWVDDKQNGTFTRTTRDGLVATEEWKEDELISQSEFQKSKSDELMRAEDDTKEPSQDSPVADQKEATDSKEGVEGVEVATKAPEPQKTTNDVVGNRSNPFGAPRTDPDADELPAPLEEVAL